MKSEAKQILLAYDISADTESNIVVTADINGVDAIFIGLKGNVGTSADAAETMSIVVEASDDGGTSTAYTSIVSTTELAAWTLTSVASTETEKTLLLSRAVLGTGARYISITVNNSATGTASETWMSVVGLSPYLGTAADYVK